MRDSVTGVAVAPVPISCHRITILTLVITVAIISRSKLQFEELMWTSRWTSRWGEGMLRVLFEAWM